MASAYHVSLIPSAEPSLFTGSTCTARRHSLLPTILCPSIAFVHFEQTDLKFLALTYGESVETEGAKRLTITSLPHFKWRRRGEVSCNAELARGPGILGTESEEGVGETAAAVPEFDLSRLEAYTEKVPSEVLFVRAVLKHEEEEDDDEEGEDEVIVFKGFSSSLTRAIPEDHSEPVLPSTAAILSIDRLRAPYSPSKPRFIQQGLSWQEFQPLLEKKGL